MPKIQRFLYLTKITTRTTRAFTAALTALLLLAGVTTASADTLLMPKRDTLVGSSTVIWGVSTQANGLPFTIDFGDTTSTSGFVSDRSYIATNHTYTAGGTYTVTLTVGAEVATVDVRVFDPASLPGGVAGEAYRGVKINMAIEDGLRYLWVAQNGRAGNFPLGATTNWGNYYPSADAALITLAFENHGYKLANDGSAPTGIYEKYIVRRGLNYVISALSTVGISSQPSGFGGQPVRDPCVGTGIEASPCTGLRNSTDSFHEAYLTGVSILPLAGSGALNRTNTEVGGYTNGKTYKEILQRLVNALAWGQIDVNNPSRGGWYYNFNSTSSDGSTVGWDVLAMLDSEAAGAVVPGWVKTEFAFALTGGLNDNGSFDYQANGVPGPQNGITGNYYAVTLEKGGIPLQGMFLIGETSGSRVDLVKSYISNRWTSGRLEDDYYWWTQCQVGGQYNLGCAYSMFNAFKGLKLQGIQTLPGVTRPAGPGSIPAGDWYADYQDWLVNNQTSPSSTGGGYWGTMQFSCCYSGANINAAIAELILSPVALVLPDADKFASFGLSPATNTAVEGGTHTVTAKAESTGGTPVPGATVTFLILTGPNAGLTGTDVTDSNGEATFTYTDAGPDGTYGTDRIQAYIGSLASNIVEMIWTPKNQPPVCSATPGLVTLWPPNHQLVPITLFGATDADGDPLTYTATSIAQDEPLTGGGNGAGNTPYDGVLSPAQVRSERNGNPKTPGNGRVYYIDFTATDPMGAFCEGQVQVCVPHDQGKGNSCIGEGPRVTSTAPTP